MPLPRSVARANKRYLNHVVRPVARFLPFLAVVHHVGRVSGREYAIPVNVFRSGDDLIVPITYSSQADWVRNVLASGWCEVEHRGRRARVAQVRLEVDREKPWAPKAIRMFLSRLGVHEILRLSPE
jgi:deazaflavin-dependent oxidoreductase (nitroreductase family)